MGSEGDRVRGLKGLDCVSLSFVVQEQSLSAEFVNGASSAAG